VSTYQAPLSSPAGYPPLNVSRRGWRRTRIALLGVVIAMAAGVAVAYALTFPLGIVKRDLPAIVTIAAGIVGDVDGDGRVTLSDLDIVALAINTGAGADRADLNSDGAVDVQDLVIVGRSFEGTPP
jgi:hypothetical protein